MTTVASSGKRSWRKMLSGTAAVGVLGIVPVVAFAEFGPGLLHNIEQSIVAIDQEPLVNAAQDVASNAGPGDGEQAVMLEDWAFTGHQPPPPPPVHAPPSHHRGYR